MKILFAGSISGGQTSKMRMDALSRMGHEVAGFDTEARWARLGAVSRRMQQTAESGAVVRQLNQELLEAVTRFRPNLLWAEKQRFLRVDTLEAIRQAGARLLHFTPDPYFTLAWKRTRIMDRALPVFDYLVTAKQYELGDYRAIGPSVIYVPLGFCDMMHRPMLPATRTLHLDYESDISFLGGWEPRREELLAAIVAGLGRKLKIWGYGWDHLRDGRLTPRRWLGMRTNAGNQPFRVRRNPELASCVQGSEVYGTQYAWGLSGGKIGVGFLRRICPDQHTTRTFEIPACGSLLLADRSDDHQDLFVEGKEAEFFDSPEELVDKAKYYVSHERQRARMATKGFERCHRGRYSYVDRVTEILRQVST